MGQFTTRIVMQGSGVKQFEVPTGMKYVSIINNTPDTVILFKGQQSYENYDSKDAVVTVTQRTSITVPLGEYNTYFSVIFKEGVVGDEPQVAQLIFSTDNLNINTQLGSPGNTNNVVISSDGAGLAKQNQFPSTLAPGDSMRTHISNQVGISSLPNITLVPGQSVGVTSIPDMGIKSGQTVGVTSLPNVVLTPGQSVNIGNQITGFATSAKQDSIITALGLISTKGKQDEIITLLGNLITLQTETNTKLQTLIDQGTPTP